MNNIGGLHQCQYLSRPCGQNKLYQWRSYGYCAPSFNSPNFSGYDFQKYCLTISHSFSVVFVAFRIMFKFLNKSYKVIQDWEYFWTVSDQFSTLIYLVINIKLLLVSIRCVLSSLHIFILLLCQQKSFLYFLGLTMSLQFLFIPFPYL